MKVLYVSSEALPFAASGGLADVAFSLPPALKQAGNDVAILTPLYQCVWQRFQEEIQFVMDVDIPHGGADYRCELYRGERDGVPVWFLRYDPFFDRPRLYGYDDDKMRFAFFSRAVIELLPELGPLPEILHCNDWETALAAIYLKNDQVTRPELKNIRTVFTIHNIAYQGQFSSWELQTTFDLPAGWYDGGLGFEYEGRHDVNLMKGAMMVADAVSTVSPTYARELHHHRYGMGLEGVAHLVDNKLQGILNGIDMDHYDPRKDPRLPAPFDPDHMAGKAACKAEIQKTFGLEQEAHFPLFSLVARLVEQKGVELIKDILPRLMDLGCQVIIFGQGDQAYIDEFNNDIQRWPGQFGFSSDYSEDMAAKVFAGSDFAGDDICLDVVCVCQPERHIDAANLGRIEILYFFRDKRPVLESLLNKTDGLLFADLKRNDEFRCFFLGNTVKDHAGAAAVDALRGGLGAVDRDLAAAGAAGVDVAVEELLGRLFIDAINFRSGDRLPVF